MTTPTRKLQLARQQLARCSQSSPDYLFFLELSHKYEDEAESPEEAEWWFQRQHIESTGGYFYMTYPHL